MSGGCGSAAQHRVVPGHADPGGPAGACAQGGRSSTKNTKITKVPVLHFIYIYITIFHLFFSSFVGLDPFLRIASFGWRISEGPIGGVFWAKAELKNHKMTRHQ